jgi:LmbE family N-acetylglucosaminyl deacetylase
MVTTSPMLVTYQDVFGDLVMRVDGVERRGVCWPEWAVTTHIDIADYQEQILDAVLCHQSQLPDNGLLEGLSQEQKQALWRVEMYCRVFGLTHSTNLQIEADPFAGLSEQIPTS